MLNITFEPTLNTTVALHPATESQTLMSLSFRAFLPPSEVTRLAQESCRLQLWSNLYASEAANGTWASTDFSPVGFDGDDSEKDALWLFEDSTSSFDEIGTKEYIARVQVAVPKMKEENWGRYEFTFRLAYADGDYTWLGDSTSNGSVVIESNPTWRIAPQESPERVTGHLSDVAQWKGWRVTPENTIEIIDDVSSVSPSTLIYLWKNTPGSSSILSFYSKHTNDLISVENSRVISDSPSTVEVYEKLPEAYLKILRASSLNWASMVMRNQPQNTETVSIFIIPLVRPSHQQNFVTIEKREIQELLPQNISNYVLYSPAVGQTQLARADPESPNHRLCISSASPNQLILIPMRKLGSAYFGLAAPSEFISQHHRRSSPSGSHLIGQNNSSQMQRFWMINFRVFSFLFQFVFYVLPFTTRSRSRTGEWVYTERGWPTFQREEPNMKSAAANGGMKVPLLEYKVHPSSSVDSNSDQEVVLLQVGRLTDESLLSIAVNGEQLDVKQLAQSRMQGPVTRYSIPIINDRINPSTVTISLLN